MHVQRIASFSTGAHGGNPAGVVITETLPSAREMQRVAAEVGFSETVFAAHPGPDSHWRVRYFSPAAEVPFCGHATIALGVALAMQQGDGVFALQLNDASITVEGAVRDGQLFAALQSPATRSAAASTAQVTAALRLFGYSTADLDMRIPPALIHAGADHLVLTLQTRAALAAMNYSLDAGRELMAQHGWITILLAFAEDAQHFHTRNAFAYGGVLEDPATGAATAAFAGYLRDLHWRHGGRIEVQQGQDMGMPSLLTAEISAAPGSSIRVSGSARVLA